MSPSPRAPQGSPPQRRRTLKLRHLLFLVLLVSGIVPLLISSARLIGENTEVLKTQEKELLTRAAQALAEDLSEDLRTRSEELRQLGRGLLAGPGAASVAERLREPWVQPYLRQFFSERPGLEAFSLLDEQGLGLSSDSKVNADVAEVMSESRRKAISSHATVYLFASGRAADAPPMVAIAVPVQAADAPAPTLFIQALARLPVDRLTSGGAAAVENLLLIDRSGNLLWSAGSDAEVDRAVLQSDLVKGFAALPLATTSELEVEVRGLAMPVVAHLVPVQETAWGVVAHKPTSFAFQQVQAMVANTAIIVVLLVAFALVLAFFAARHLGRPIQRLAETTHEIAAGRFDRRVDTRGLAFELADLAEDFNRMSVYLENYVAQLREAAAQNRELFIGSIRAFAAAVDAKDPYTRGHSERVAAYSRSIARYLGLPDDVVERVWISAVLHDIGKIGVADTVLKKHGVLTPEEFEQMKLHPVIGAEIAEPIGALREMIPGIRWHHEGWNGTGYPDGLRGEQIPLMARIIGVADTFDAITTNRPYQTASSPEKAIEIIKRLTGTKFDAKITTAFLLAWEAGRIKMDKERADSESTEVRLAGQRADLVTN